MSVTNGNDLFLRESKINHSELQTHVLIGHRLIDWSPTLYPRILVLTEI